MTDHIERVGPIEGKAAKHLPVADATLRELGLDRNDPRLAARLQELAPKAADVAAPEAADTTPLQWLGYALLSGVVWTGICGFGFYDSFPLAPTFLWATGISAVLFFIAWLDSRLPDYLLWAPVILGFVGVGIGGTGISGEGGMLVGGIVGAAAGHAFTRLR